MVVIHVEQNNEYNHCDGDKRFDKFRSVFLFYEIQQENKKSDPA